MKKEEWISENIENLREDFCGENANDFTEYCVGYQKLAETFCNDEDNAEKFKEFCDEHYEDEMTEEQESTGKK